MNAPGAALELSEAVRVYGLTYMENNYGSSRVDLSQSVVTVFSRNTLVLEHKERARGVILAYRGFRVSRNGAVRKSEPYKAPFPCTRM